MKTARQMIEEAMLSKEDQYDFIHGGEEIDVREMLARQKINIVYSNFRLDTEDEELDKIFENIKKNNDFMQLMKGMEKYLSKDGKSYLVWDIFEKEDGYDEKTIKIFQGLPNSQRNQTVRQLQQKELVGTCEIQTISTKQGIRQKVYQCRTLTETKNMTLDNAVPQEQIPIDIFWIKTPKWLKPYMTPHTRKHNYGVLSIKEMLNKNIIDFQDVNDRYLPDDAPVNYLVEQINSFLTFIKKEQMKNGTKWAGTFNAYGDMQDDKETANFAMNGNKINQNVYNKFLGRNGKKNILSKDYIMFLPTGSNNTIEKMQSTFDMEAMMRGLTSLLETYFNGAGFDYAVQTQSGASQYTSSSEIQTQNRRTTETVKECVLLRQEQYTEIINNIIDAWYGRVGKHKDFKDKWEFKIISNIVNEEAYSVEKIVLMLENGLISKDLAIEKANKDLNQSDIRDLIETIKKEQEEAEAKELKLMQAGESEGSNNE